jgi:hypothetical protein
MNIEYKKIKDYLRYIPDFYKEILQTWIKMGGGHTKTLSHFAEIRKQLIWGNKFIMFKNKSCINFQLSISPLTNLLIHDALSDAK